MGTIRVLNLVTNGQAQFFRNQVTSLESLGVEQTTVAVPGIRTTTENGTDRRSMMDYARFLGRVLSTRTDEYDLVHANYGLTAPAALTQWRCPVVISLWGSDLFGRFGRVVRWCSHRADQVIVMSQEMADEFGDECRIIPHGVDLSLFRQIPTAPARTAVGWTETGRHVLFPYSSQRAVKNFSRAEGIIEEARHRVDTEVYIHTVEGVPHSLMPLYLNAADALLLTSKWEGSPNSVKEAMACNVPVVATDVGDVGERLDGVEPSCVGRTDEALVAGLVDVLRRGERSNGRQAVQSVSLDRMGEQLIDVYRSAVRESQKRHPVGR